MHAHRTPSSQRHHTGRHTILSCAIPSCSLGAIRIHRFMSERVTLIDAHAAHSFWRVPRSSLRSGDFRAGSLHDACICTTAYCGLLPPTETDHAGVYIIICLDSSLGFGGGEAPPTRVRSLFQKKLPRCCGPSRSRGGSLLSSSPLALPYTISKSGVGLPGEGGLRGWGFGLGTASARPFGTQRRLRVLLCVPVSPSAFTNSLLIV